MLIILSPSKTIEASYPQTDYEMSTPHFTEEVRELSALLRKMKKADLGKLMKTSEKLTEATYELYQNWRDEFTEENAHSAMYSFKGGVYVGLDALSLDQADITFAQDHLRMLSGLYGVLRPLDLMQPYRLEMGSRLATKKGKNMYQYWGDKIAKRLNAQLAEHGQSLLVNLASDEYYKSVDQKTLDADVVTCDFREERDGVLKFISFNAKKARGQMAHYIIKHKITEREVLQGFDYDGYVYREELSEAGRLMFVK